MKAPAILGTRGHGALVRFTAQRTFRGNNLLHNNLKQFRWRFDSNKFPVMFNTGSADESCSRLLLGWVDRTFLKRKVAVVFNAGKKCPKLWTKRIMPTGGQKHIQRPELVPYGDRHPKRESLSRAMETRFESWGGATLMNLR